MQNCEALTQDQSWSHSTMDESLFSVLKTAASFEKSKEIIFLGLVRNTVFPVYFSLVV